MAPTQNSTLINLINDDIKSITSERLSPIAVQETESSEGSDNESELTEEIPIYINQVPRYISGVNCRTTCNDIIKALIDDELANTKTSKQLICDPSHYILYERFQDIEHALDGEELIYELWKNWGDNRRDVQFRLKINKEFEMEMKEGERHRAKDKKIRKNGIKKLLKKVIQQGEMIQKCLIDMHHKQHLYLEPCSENSDFEIAQCDDGTSTMKSCSRWNNAEITDTEDELFLIIENHNDNDSGVFISKEQRTFHEMEYEECKMTLEMTPKRKFRYDRDFDSLKDHAINDMQSVESFTRTSCKFELIHKELKSEMNNVKEIIDQEHSFLRRINRRRSSLDNVTFDNTLFNDFCDNNETVIL